VSRVLCSCGGDGMSRYSGFICGDCGGAGYVEEKDDVEKTVQTIAGTFDRRRYKSLCLTLANAAKEGMDRDEVIMFEGNELLISFGEHLRNSLDLTFAQRDHKGL
jgi:DnaJ-class molecular chaperone